MGAIYFPLLRSNFQKKIAPEQIYIEADGEKINLAQVLSRKVNIFQGEANKNKILITDQHGNVTVTIGVVMQQSERDTLKKLNPGTATDLDGNRINVRFDPASFGIDNENRLTLIDPADTSHTHEIKDVNQLREELDDRILISQPDHPGKMLVVDSNTKRITFVEIPKGVEITQYLTEGLQIAEINGTKIYAPDYQFTTDEHDDIITHEDRITSLENKVNAFFDIDVKNWTEFLSAVEVSHIYSVRIHFRADIKVHSVPSYLDLSNCLIYGHYHGWIVNDKTIPLRGQYGSFYDVWFKGADDGGVSTPIFRTTHQGRLSNTYYFENCRFYNFLERSDAPFIIVNGEQSTHFILERCVVNGESSDTSSRTLLLMRKSGLCMTMKVVDCMYSGKDTETNKFGFASSSSLMFNGSVQDAFHADGSCVFGSDYKSAGELVELDNALRNSTTEERISAYSEVRKYTVVEYQNKTYPNANNTKEEEYIGYVPTSFHQWGAISVVRLIKSGTPIASLNGSTIYAPDLAYSIEEVTATSGYLKSCQLAKTDANNVKTYLPGTIDIPKDLFLRTVDRVSINAQNAVQNLPHGDYFRFVFNTADGDKTEYIPIDTLRAEMTAGRHIFIDGTIVSAAFFVPQYDDLDDALPEEIIVQYIGESGGGYVSGYFYERNPNTWETAKWKQKDVQPRTPAAHTHDLSEILDNGNPLATATDEDIRAVALLGADGQPLPPGFNDQLTYATNEDIITLFPNLDEYTSDNNAAIADDNDINGIFGG